MQRKNDFSQRLNARRLLPVMQLQVKMQRRAERTYLQVKKQ